MSNNNYEVMISLSVHTLMTFTNSGETSISMVETINKN